MFKKIIIVIIVAIAALFGYAATLPDDLRVERSASINAPAEAIFPYINDLDSHALWSPFVKDKEMKQTHSGEPSGKGEVFEWEGDSETGTGRIEITESVPSSKIAMQLDMIKPMEGHNQINFRLADKGGNTDITWTIEGKKPFIGKVIGIFYDCEAVVGKQFEDGLANLKAIAEKQATGQ